MRLEKFARPLIVQNVCQNEETQQNPWIIRVCRAFLRVRAAFEDPVQGIGQQRHLTERGKNSPCKANGPKICGLIEPIYLDPHASRELKRRRARLKPRATPKPQRRIAFQLPHAPLAPDARFTQIAQDVDKDGTGVVHRNHRLRASCVSSTGSDHPSTVDNRLSMSAMTCA